MMLRSLASALRDIFLFRGGPEELPWAPRLLLGLLLACALMQLGFNLHEGISPALVAGALLGGLAMLGALAQLLRWRGKPERFVQAASALAAAYLLFGLAKNSLAVLLPVREWQAKIAAEPGHLPLMTGQQTLVASLVVAVAVWQACVWIVVLRRALEIPVAGSVLVFLLLALTNIVATVLVASVITSAMHAV